MLRGLMLLCLLTVTGCMLSGCVIVPEGHGYHHHYYHRHYWR